MNSERNRQRALEYHRSLRLQLLAAYGGKCECCGETREAFLSLDHKNNDGAAHRISLRKNKASNYKDSKNSTCAWNDLKKRGWPKDNYRLACYNCNVGRHRNTGNRGICPHEIERGEIVSRALTEILPAVNDPQTDWLSGKPVGAP